MGVSFGVAASPSWAVGAIVSTAVTVISLIRRIVELMRLGLELELCLLLGGIFLRVGVEGGGGFTAHWRLLCICVIMDCSCDV